MIEELEMLEKWLKTLNEKDHYILIEILKEKINLLKRQIDKNKFENSCGKRGCRVIKLPYDKKQRKIE